MTLKEQIENYNPFDEQEKNDKFNPEYVTAVYWMPKYNECPVDFWKVAR